MSDWHFRPAVPGDEGLILQFIRELAEYENLAGHVRATEDSFRQHLFGPVRYIEAMIAERGGEPVGFALWHYTYSSFTGAPTLYVEDVYVRAAHRGGGLGRAIFRHLARVALSRGCHRMDWAVLETNAPAIAFYARLGAKPIDSWLGRRLSGEALAALAA